MSKCRKEKRNPDSPQLKGEKLPVPLVRSELRKGKGPNRENLLRRSTEEKTKSRRPSSKRRKISSHGRQKLQFGPFLTAISPLLFRKIGISLAKDSVLYLSDLLEDVCHELASVSAQKAARSKELNAERVHAAVKEVFAKRMSEKQYHMQQIHCFYVKQISGEKGRTWCGNKYA
ncbi:hypothetical protein CEXT_16841 [Caerostris extrusa]|uniref:Histone H2A/H2B/H3 domain-containing protein n=1 Tax=Caerostris extrusa TaxID=172846 RepID=A0AAV4NWF3_CAEEX|nr:hypothetical protein CEXT_16841 [Caerostris extrusa]